MKAFLFTFFANSPKYYQRSLVLKSKRFIGSIPNRSKRSMNKCQHRLRLCPFELMMPWIQVKRDRKPYQFMNYTSNFNFKGIVIVTNFWIGLFKQHYGILKQFNYTHFSPPTFNLSKIAVYLPRSSIVKYLKYSQ